MSWHLSTFSSNLSASRLPLPRAAALCIMLLIMLNIFVNQLERIGILYPSNPYALIDGALSELKQGQDYWWIGNSTMAAGISEDFLAGYGIKGTFVHLGSANLEVLTNLAEAALEKSKKHPQKIFIFFTKDDLNENGSRALKSLQYLDAIEGGVNADRAISRIPLVKNRFSIRDQVVKFIYNPKNDDTPGSQPDLELDMEVGFDSELGSNYLFNLGANFKMLDLDFKSLDQARDRGKTEISIISPPVTAVVAQWQANHYPSRNWQYILSSVRDRANSRGIEFRDYSAHLASSTRYFKDPYHLNDVGARKFSKLILEEYWPDASGARAR